MPETYDWVPWPPRYVDDDGRWHDWDDQIPEGGMTYRELAFELASAQGLDIEEWLTGDRPARRRRGRTVG